MPHYLRPVLCALGLMAASACAQSAKGSSDSAPVPKAGAGDVVIAPQMTGGTGVMAFRSSGTRPRGTVEIPVDASGRPEIYGIRYIGAFSEVTRRDIAEFVGQATFVPAKRNGVPERGVFKMTFR